MSITDVHTQLATLADRLPIPQITLRLQDSITAADRLAVALQGTDNPEAAHAPRDVHTANTLVSGEVERMVAAHELINTLAVRL